MENHRFFLFVMRECAHSFCGCLPSQCDNHGMFVLVVKA